MDQEVKKAVDAAKEAFPMHNASNATMAASIVVQALFAAVLLLRSDNKR
jgi:hypothetical protein